MKVNEERSSQPQPMHRQRSGTVFFVFALAAAPLTAQPGGDERELTLEAVLARPSVLAPTMPRVQWIPDSTLLATVQPQDKLQTAHTRQAPDGDWTPAFTSPQLQAALLAAGAADVPADRFPPLGWIDRSTVRVALKDGIYHWTIGAEKAVRRLTPLARATASAVAPGDAIGAWVVDHDLHIARGDGAQRVTEDGSEDLVYGGAAHRAEFGIVDGLWWDASGRRLAFSREDLGPIALYPYADYVAHPTEPVHGRYPMAGRQHSSVTIGVYDSADDSIRYLEHDPTADLYWTNVTFSPDGEKIYVALVNRDQDRTSLVRFDAATGKREKRLFSETDEEWTEPEHGPIFVPGDDTRFLWFSPRDGYRHLYLHDVDGDLLGQVTSGERDVRSCLGFDGSGRALVMASDNNPREMHLWAATLGDDEMTRLSKPRGWHQCVASSGGELVLDRHSSLEHPGSIALVSTDDGESWPVAHAEDPRAGYRVPDAEFFVVQASDGTILHGLLLTPPGAATADEKQYPVLQYVYGGPHSQLVRDTWLGGASPWLHFLSSQGFVVFVLDNRGTDNRGIEFSQSIFRRVGSLEVEDQARALAEVSSLPFVDPERVGVHGWSFGGFMTLSLMLAHPDLYACGISGAPVTDWAQYETGYTERYMDTPEQNPEGYAASSVLPRAEELDGRLLLIQGTDDKTVMFSHSMRFLRACIDAGELVEFMAYPMQKHGLRGGDRSHLYRLMTRYLTERLRP